MIDEKQSKCQVCGNLTWFPIYSPVTDLYYCNQCYDKDRIYYLKMEDAMSMPNAGQLKEKTS
jgi:hypothetical protein